jgi:hypothetical protein
MFYNDEGGQFRCKFRGLFKLFFIIAYMVNLYTSIGSYFDLSFVMVEVDNVHAQLGGYFMYFFYNDIGG